MNKSPEKYQPSEEEIKKAEGTMTPEQKADTELREIHFNLTERFKTGSEKVSRYLSASSEERAEASELLPFGLKNTLGLSSLFVRFSHHDEEMARKKMRQYFGGNEKANSAFLEAGSKIHKIVLSRVPSLEKWEEIVTKLSLLHSNEEITPDENELAIKNGLDIENDPEGVEEVLTESFNMAAVNSLTPEEFDEFKNKSLEAMKEMTPEDSDPIIFHVSLRE